MNTQGSGLLPPDPDPNEEIAWLDAQESARTAADALSDMFSVAEDIREQLTQISNTLARTLDREQTRFITVTRVFEGLPGGTQAELVNVGGIERVFPRDGGGAYLVIPSDTLRVAESLDEISTMINAGAYVPPF